MTSEFKFIDHTADIALEISGSTYEELFLAAFYGFKESLLELSDAKRKNTEKSLTLKENSAEELLVSFLDELNFYFEKQKIFPLEVEKIKITRNDNSFKLITTISLGDITSDDHVKSEIKAVTFHQLDIKKINNVYKTIIVFDI
jgi:SHS2 domain-containing protein